MPRDGSRPHAATSRRRGATPGAGCTERDGWRQRSDCRSWVRAWNAPTWCGCWWRPAIRWPSTSRCWRSRPTRRRSRCRPRSPAPSPRWRWKRARPSPWAGSSPRSNRTGRRRTRMWTRRRLIRPRRQTARRRMRTRTRRRRMRPRRRTRRRRLRVRRRLQPRPPHRARPARRLLLRPPPRPLRPLPRTGLPHRRGLRLLPRPRRPPRRHPWPHRSVSSVRMRVSSPAMAAFRLPHRRPPRRRCRHHRRQRLPRRRPPSRGPRHPGAARWPLRRCASWRERSASTSTRWRARAPTAG